MVKRTDQISEIVLGNLGAKVNLRAYDGVEKDPVLNTTLSTGNYGLIEQTTHGKHIAVPLAATAVTAAPTPANSVLLVDDAGLAVGVGKYLRLYDAAGVDFVQLTSDADGGLGLGGSGTHAGQFSLTTLEAGVIRLLNGSDYAQLQASAGGGLVLGGSGLTAGLFSPSVVRVGDGLVAAPSFAFTNEIGTGLYRVGAGRLGVAVGGSPVLEVAGGKVLIGDTSDANVTVGLTINQGSNDDLILAFKSSDVSNLFTSLFEADTYGAISKASLTGGGVSLAGICGSGTIGVTLAGLSAVDNTARSTSAIGCVTVNGFVSSGSTTATPGANANLFVVRSAAAARFLVDAEGDIFMDATSNINAWDDYDDVALLEAYRLTTAPGADINYRQRFSEDVERHARVLADTGVLALNEDGHHFVSLKALFGLVIDSIRMVAAEQRATHADVTTLRQQMLGA